MCQIASDLRTETKQENRERDSDLKILVACSVVWWRPTKQQRQEVGVCTGRWSHFIVIREGEVRMKISVTDVTSIMLIREEDYVERCSHRYVWYCTQRHIGEQFKWFMIVLFYTETRCGKLPLLFLCLFDRSTILMSVERIDVYCSDDSRRLNNNTCREWKRYALPERQERLDQRAM